VEGGFVDSLVGCWQKQQNNRGMPRQSGRLFFFFFSTVFWTQSLVAVESFLIGNDSSPQGKFECQSSRLLRVRASEPTAQYAPGTVQYGDTLRQVSSSQTHLGLAPTVCIINHIFPFTNTGIPSTGTVLE